MYCPFDITHLLPLIALVPYRPINPSLSLSGVNATTTVVPVAQGRVVRAPLGNIGTMGPQAGTLIGMQRPILIQNDKGASPAPTLQTTLAAGRGGGVIDLTDEDEGEERGSEEELLEVGRHQGQCIWNI